MDNDTPKANTGVKNKEFKKRLTKEERAIRRKVYDRYDDMFNDGLRQEAEKDWDMADKQFRQYVPPVDADDWRAHLTLPDGFAAVQAQMQETLLQKSRPKLTRVEDSDEAVEELGNAVLNHNMDRTDFDYQYFLAKYSAAIRGTAVLHNYYRIDKRKVNDLKSVNKDTGELEFKEREITDFDDDYTEWIPLERWGIDPAAKHISEARDTIRREILNIDEFKRIYKDKPGFKNVEYVTPGGELQDGQFFKMPDDMNSDDVEVLHYDNRSEDLYYVCANNMPIYWGPLNTKHKELPYTVVYQYRLSGQFWGLGIPKIIHSLTEERTALRRLNLDRQKLSQNKMFLHNSAFDLDEEELASRPHGLISVDTQGQPLNQVIQPLEYGDVPASFYRTEETLLEDIRRAHGIDDRIQGVNVGGTATEAAILKEQSQKRINMIARLAEMDSLTRLGRLKWSNIQFYYPIPRIERITQDNKEVKKKVYRTIQSKGKEFQLVDRDGGGKELRMLEVPNSASLRLTPSFARYLEGDFDVVVTSDDSARISKPIQQAKITEMFNLLSANPALVGVLDPKKSVRRYLEINDEDPDKWLTGTDQRDMQSLADAENMIMLEGTPLPGTEGATEEHTLVHIQLTKTPEFQNASEAIQEIITNHILEEHDSNPATNSAAEAIQGAGEGTEGVEGALPPEGALVPGEEPQLSAEGPGNEMQVADLQPTTFGPEE